MLFAVRVLTIVMIERQALFYIVHAVFLKKVWGRQKFSFDIPQHQGNFLTLIHVCGLDKT